jgi:glucosamine--fructose-6-phosphate aminotransferase (isomerizing)
MHGPLELLRGISVLLIRRMTVRVFTRLLDKMRQTGAHILVAEEGGLPLFAPIIADPISIIQTAYRFVEATAVARGRNPDKPRLLKKVTETV